MQEMTRAEMELFILLNAYEMMKDEASERLIGVLMDMISDVEQKLV